MIPSIPTRTVRRLKWLPRLLAIPALALAFAAPAAEAGPRDHRHRDRHHGHHQARHHDHHRFHHARRHHVPRVVHRHHRAWPRHGFHGPLPPIGYVTHHYVTHLPRHHRVVYRNGHRFYYVNGVHYWPATYHGRGIFVQIGF